MRTKQLFRSVSLILAAFGALLLVETGRLAIALGAVAGSTPPAGGFWYQLAFMRLFGVTLLGLAGLCLWAASQLTATQQRSLGQMLCGVFGLLALVTVAQQVAIWGAMAGWAMAAAFGLIATLLGSTTIAPASRHAA